MLMRGELAIPAAYRDAGAILRPTSGANFDLRVVLAFAGVGLLATVLLLLLAPFSVELATALGQLS